MVRCRWCNWWTICSNINCRRWCTKNPTFPESRVSTSTMANYLEFFTAVINKKPVRGIDAAKMVPVTAIPNSGVPELSSNTEPTAAIAEIEAPSRQIPVMGVYMNDYFTPEMMCWTCWREKPFFLSSSIRASSFSTRSTNNTPVRWSSSCWMARASKPSALRLRGRPDSSR